MGLRVDGAVGRADDRAPRALLGVRLQEVERPKQMLWAPTLGEKRISGKERPEILDNADACPKELAEEPSFGGDRAKTARRPILDLATEIQEIGHLAVFPPNDDVWMELNVVCRSRHGKEWIERMGGDGEGVVCCVVVG